MFMGYLMIGAGFIILAFLAMSDPYHALAGLPVGSAGGGGLSEFFPVGADLPAILSYTCWIGEFISTGGFCGM